MYRSLVRPLLFRLDSESAHHLAIGAAAIVGCSPLRSIFGRFYNCEDPRLETQCFGLRFANPVGLAAGFDKDARAVPFLGALGFGFLELGTVTAHPQPGNPRPRIFRLPDDSALINRMGFPSAGAQAVSERMKALRSRSTSLPIIGINIGKTKAVSLEEALQDYVQSFSLLQPYADYVVLNVSSPNTPELRKLQERVRLEALFRGVQQANVRKIPLLIKIAPDLAQSDLDEVLAVCEACGVSGLVVTNTTFSRDGLSQPIDQTGGLSGKPLHGRAVQMVGRIFRATNGKLPIIGVGGVFSASDVLDFIRAGASLIQVYTGLVYEGPGLVCRIKRDLVEYLSAAKIERISDLRGNAA